MDFPAWFDGKTINETLFCEEFSRYARGETPLRVVDPALGY